MSEAANNPVSSVTGARVFLSYNREDRHFARQLELVLSDRGYDPLVDVQAIVPGEPWEERLTNMISQSDTVVFVLTEDYLASENCAWELKEAERMSKRMIPVLPGPLPEGLVVPAELSSLQYIYFYSDHEIPDSGFYVGMHKLEEGLRLDLDWLRQKRRYEERADDWSSAKNSELLLAGLLLEEAEKWHGNIPNGNETSPEIDAFIAASREREDKRLKRAKRARSVGWGAAALTLVLAAATGLSWWQAREARDDLTTSLKDNDLLANAANSWAASRQELAQINIEHLHLEDNSDFALDIAFDGILRVNEAISGLSPSAQTAYSKTIWSMQRDYAKLLYFKNDATSVDVMTDLIAQQKAALGALDAADPDASGDVSDKAEERAERRTELAIDYLSRSVYACAPDASMQPGSELVTLDASLFEDAQVWSSLKFASENNNLVCSDALYSVCDAVPQHELCLFVEAPAMAAPPPPPAPPPPASMPAPVREESDTNNDNEQSEPPVIVAQEPDFQVNTPQQEQIIIAQDDSYIPIQQQARQRVFKRVAAPDRYRITEAYLHISDESQRAAAKLFAAQLETRGYEVLGIELVKGKNNRSIRYFYDVQISQVEDELVYACMDAAEAAVLQAPDDQTMKTLENWTTGYDRLISLDGRYKGLRANRVEIWF